MLNRDKIHNYQKTAITNAINKAKYYLALDLGLGKTIVSLTTIVDTGCKNVLVVAPKRVCENVWEAEALNWEHTKHLTFSNLVGKTPNKRKELLKSDATVKIVNTELFLWLLKLYPNKKLPFDMIVIDEAHTFKDWGSKRFKTFKPYTKNLQRVLMLSGTPASNSLLNLWAQVFILDGGARLGKFIGGFKDTYFDSDYMGYNFTPKAWAEKAIYDKLSDIMISMKASDYIELPELMFNDISVPLDSDSQEVYNTLKRESIVSFLAENTEVTAINAAVLSSRLIQMASGTAYDEEKNVILVHDNKLSALKDLVDSMQGAPVIVLYKYKCDVPRIKDTLKGVYTLDDGADIVKRWNDKEIPVLLLNPQGASCGLNLQHGGHNIIEFTPSFSLQDTIQVYGRLFRQGQKNNVIVHRLLVEGTMDVRVIESLQHKKTQQDRLLSAIKAEIDDK